MTKESLKNKTVKGVIWNGLGSFSSQGISFVFTIIIARILTPQDYGIVGMLTIFMAICQAFVNSGFSQALVRKIDRSEEDNATAFYFNIVVGIASYVIMFLAAPWIASFYNQPILTSITRVVALNLILSSFCIVQQAQLTINIDFKTQANISIISTVLSGIVGLSFALLGYGVWALVVQGLISTIVQSVLVWIFVKWRPRERFSKESFHNLFGFGSKLLASGLLDTIYNNLYVLVIGKVFSASTLGLYSRATSLAQFPSSNITGIIQRVTFPVLATIQDEDERLRDNYRRLLRMSAFIIFPLMTLLAAVAQPLIQILLGEKWLGCVIYLQILCFSMMWYPIHAINLNLLQVKGRSDLFLKLEVIKKIMGVIILAVTIPIGVVAMCIGQVVASILSLVINIHYTGKLIHLGFIKQMNDLIPILLSSLFSMALAFVCNSFFQNSVLQLSLGCLFALMSYFGTAYIFKSPELREVSTIIKNHNGVN